MPLRLSIPNARKLAPSVWEANLDLAEISFLGSRQSKSGDVNVLLIAGEVSYHGDILAFEPRSAQVLNAGTSTRAILVHSPAPHQEVGQDQFVTSNGDVQFLSRLPHSLRDMGDRFLRDIREEFPGQLVHEGARHINRPNNFFAIRIQPRDKSFRITVRGTPSALTKPRSFSLSLDRNGYSSFKISHNGQVEEAMTLLRQASKRRR